jgi:hypothetical protein
LKKHPTATSRLLDAFPQPGIRLGHRFPLWDNYYLNNAYLDAEEQIPLKRIARPGDKQFNELT